MVEKKIENLILTAQKSEITEHSVYHKLSQSVTNPHNKSVLKQISDDELKHYNFWRKYTRQDAKPNKLSLWKYYLISRIFGITFGIKRSGGDEGGQLHPGSFFSGSVHCGHLYSALVLAATQGRAEGPCACPHSGRHPGCRIAA